MRIPRDIIEAMGPGFLADVEKLANAKLAETAKLAKDLDSQSESFSFLPDGTKISDNPTGSYPGLKGGGATDMMPSMPSVSGSTPNIGVTKPTPAPFDTSKSTRIGGGTGVVG